MLRDDGKPASTRKSVLEAVTFSRFVLGIPELMPLGESKRCHGSARLRDFKARVQASPFTVDELAKLHKILFEDPEPWNQLMAGSILFCTYGRARWEDLEHSDVLIVDMGDDGLAAFIEVGVGVHKTIYLWWRLRLGWWKATGLSSTSRYVGTWACRIRSMGRLCQLRIGVVCYDQES